MKPAFSFNQLLYAFIGFIILMLAFRAWYFGSRHNIFLVWNLFLGWIPYVTSKFFSAKRTGWRQRSLFAFWLLFWPNALYIVTDLIHLHEASGVPVCFDALIIFSAAVAGLMMAFVSLFRIEQFITAKLSPLKANILMLSVIFLGSFGVYLGRFQRFNSWDILHDPFELVNSIGSHLLFPKEHLHTWAVTLLFTITFSFMYYIFKVLPGAINNLGKQHPQAV